MGKPVSLFHFSPMKLTVKPPKLLKKSLSIKQPSQPKVSKGNGFGTFKKYSF